MKRILLISFVLLSALISEAWAQRTVSGKVISSVDREGLPGVTVQAKGTSTGVITDLEGNYRIQVPEEANTLVFSFVGFTSQEVQIGNRSVIDVTLREDVKQLQEVVVTAVGIERESRALGYAIENVAGQKVQQVAEPDPLRALQGKVAGVNIGGSSGAPGSSTRITIRGNSSLLGDNQPLFVVDGIPYNNETNNLFPGLQAGSANTSRIADLDPNNIESISILKGAAAASLYGTRAANGVVVITTKTGSTGRSRKGLEVTYSTSYSWEKIANLPDYQNTYGTGTNFAYQQVNGSWGAPFIGTRPYATTDSIPHWYAGRPGMEAFDGQRVPYRAYPDNVENLFRTGHIFENSISVQGGNEKSNIGVTVSRTDHEGYVPNTEFERTNISVGGRTLLENNLSVGANIQYTRSNQKAVQSGVGNSGGNNQSAFARALYLGRNWDIHGQPYQNPVDLGSEFMVGRGQADNPLWSYENAGGRENTDRVLASIDFGYNFTESLRATYKVGINTYNQRSLDFIRPGSTGPGGEGNIPGVGRVTEANTRFEEIESNFILSYEEDLSEDFSIRAFVGQNINQRTRNTQGFMGVNYVTFDIDDLDNTNNVTPYFPDDVGGFGYSQRRIIGLFADVTLGYRDWAYLTVSGRNDWSSTLPVENRSFFYPAVSGSVILSEALNITSGSLSYLKLRANVAQVGKDTDPYQLQSVFNVNPFDVFPFRGQPGASLSNILYDPNLKPERTREYELGLESRLFNDRIGLDVAVYDRLSFDQIAPVSLASVTGFSTLYTNFGSIRNRGIEIGLDLTPIRTDNFNWNIYTAFTRNRNTIEELREGVEEIIFGSYFSGGVVTVHRPGQPFGLLLGSVAARDQEGNLLIDPANGQLILAPEPAIIGNPNPDFLLGLTNTFSYKGLTLSAVFDWRQGGDLWSNTILSLLGRGVTKDTEDREMNWVIPGVYGDATTYEPIRRPEDGSKIPNQTMIETNSLWFGNSFAINGMDEWTVFDATTYRLREATLAYTLPKSLIEGSPFGSVSLGFTGRNLWYFAPGVPKYTNYDPEVNQFGNSNQQGIEWSVTPTTRRYSLNLRVSF